MKRVILLLIAVACLTGSSFAAGSPTIIKSAKKSLSVYFQDWNQQELTVKIKNDLGITVMTDRVKNGNVEGKKYNLKNLNVGNYTLEISNDQKMLRQPVVLFDDQVQIVASNAVTFYKPVLNQENKKLDINLFSQGKDVKIKITDGQSNIIHKSEFTQAAKVTERFDLSQLDSGTYRVSVNQGDYIYSKTIMIK